MFTLQWKDGPFPRALSEPQALLGLPDGSVLVASADVDRPNFYRLWPEGRATRIPGADHAGQLALERDGRVLFTKPGSDEIWRLDLSGRRAVRVAALHEQPSWGATSGPEINAMATLQDGNVLVATASELWSLAPGTSSLQRVPVPELLARGEIHTLAPLGSGFVAGGFGPLVRVDAKGRADRLPLSNAGALTGTRDGRALAVVALGRAEPRSAFVLIGPEGSITPLRSMIPPGFGDGDGQRAAAIACCPGPITVAGDGSLVFADGLRLSPDDESGRGTLRALVPRSSTRLRIAITRPAYQTFIRGRISFLASAAGTVELTLRHRGKIVRTMRRKALAGPGELRLPSTPKLGEYEARLRLLTPTGVAEGRARFDTRPVLPLASARTALASAYGSSEGDEGGREGQEVGRCSRGTPRVVTCWIMRFLSGNNLDETDDSYFESSPAFRAVTTLRADGIHIRRDSRERRPVDLGLRVDFRRFQRVTASAGVQLAIRAAKAARCRVHVEIDVPGRPTPIRVVAVRQMQPGRTWRPVLHLPAVALEAAGRRTLTARAHVSITARRARAEWYISPLQLVRR